MNLRDNYKLWMLVQEGHFLYDAIAEVRMHRCACSVQFSQTAFIFRKSKLMCDKHHHYIFHHVCQTPQWYRSGSPQHVPLPSRPAAEMEINSLFLFIWARVLRGEWLIISPCISGLFLLVSASLPTCLSVHPSVRPSICGLTWTIVKWSLVLCYNIYIDNIFSTNLKPVMLYLKLSFRIVFSSINGRRPDQMMLDISLHCN